MIHTRGIVALLAFVVAAVAGLEINGRKVYEWLKSETAVCYDDTRACMLPIVDSCSR